LQKTILCVYYVTQCTWAPKYCAVDHYTLQLHLSITNQHKAASTLPRFDSTSHRVEAV